MILKLILITTIYLLLFAACTQETSTSSPQLVDSVNSSSPTTSITEVIPYLSLRYPLTPWFGFDLSLGYFLTFYDPNGWEANKSPVADKQEVGLSNTFFKIAFIFGG